MTLMKFGGKDTEGDRWIAFVQVVCNRHRRMTLFGLFFFPAGIMVSDFLETFNRLGKVNPKMKLLGEGTLPISGGFYPWQWVRSELESFKALQVTIQKS